MDDATAAVAARVSSLADLVLLLDVDGTLAPIVEDPTAVAVPKGALHALGTIVSSAALVGVVSGRSVDVIDRLVPIRGIWRAGAHGVHVRGRDGRDDVDPATAAARPQLELAVRIATEHGWRFEDKGHSVTLHVRGEADADDVLAAARAAWEDALDLDLVEVADARQALEVRVRGARTKADAVRMAVAVASRGGRSPEADQLVVAFAGDDRTDLDAFAEVATHGPRGLRIAVDSPEAPPELLAQADLVVDGPAGVEHLLTAIAELAGA